MFENMPITNLNLSGCNGTYNEETDEMEGGLTGELLLMPQRLTPFSPRRRSERKRGRAGGQAGGRVGPPCRPV